MLKTCIGFQDTGSYDTYDELNIDGARLGSSYSTRTRDASELELASIKSLDTDSSEGVDVF